MEKKRKVVIVGASAFAQIAHEYFHHDSDYEVAGFSVEAEHLTQPEFCGLPLVAFETIERSFPPTEHDVYVAVVYGQLNRLRARLSSAAKQKGYRLASYVSSRAFVWPNVRMGEHCFIFENNVVQPFVCLGNDVVLWSGNHVGHHSTIEDHCFVSSHVVISGYAVVQEFCFLGVNATISNNVTVARDCWIGPGVVVTKNTKPGTLYKAARAEPSPVSAYDYFKVAPPE